MDFVFCDSIEFLVFFNLVVFFDLFWFLILGVVKVLVILELFFLGFIFWFCIEVFSVFIVFFIIWFNCFFLFGVMKFNELLLKFINMFSFWDIEFNWSDSIFLNLFCEFCDDDKDLNDVWDDESELIVVLLLSFLNWERIRLIIFSISGIVVSIFFEFLLVFCFFFFVLLIIVVFLFLLRRGDFFNWKVFFLNL